MGLSGILMYVMRAARFALAVGAVYALGRWLWLRAKGEKPGWVRELVRLLFVVYAAALVQIIALRGGAGDARAVQPVPLRTTLGELRAGLWPFIYHLVGNAVWFVPLGMFLHKKGAVRALLFGAGVSAALECLQWILGTGVTDVDDVIINALGALAGCLLMRLGRRNR
ncbi:MAG: VanZ family protein [Clostridia bacterium]|nr:VanZ family protein [Clostridia bacterium]